MAEGGLMLEDDGKFPCLICGQKGLTQQEMRIHIMAEHVERDVCCPFCDLSGITSNEMNLHINSTHLKDSDWNSDSEPTDPESSSEATSTIKELNSIHQESPTKQPELSDERKPQYVLLEVKSPTKDMKTSQMSHKSSESSDSIERMQESSDSMSCSNVSMSASSVSTDSIDKSQLTLDISPPREDVGVLRMTHNFFSNINVGISSSRGSLHNGMDFQARRNPRLMNPDINDNVEPDINSNIPGEFSCPLCQFSTISEQDIQTHVNREHLDLLSPCKGANLDQDMTDDDSIPQCPLCKTVMHSGEELLLHVNTAHSDILSPDQSQGACGHSVTPSASWQGTSSSHTKFNGVGNSWQNIVTCPVCDLEFDDAAILEIHVNGHFSTDNTPVSENDYILAQELEKSQEDDQEQREFQALQAMYGMSGNSSYKKQYEKNLDRTLTKGEMTVAEYHMRKQSMKSRDLAGVEDGHSCTKGLMEHLAGYYGSRPGNILNVYLASHVDHFSGSYGDKGWGCGYRNFQMLLSALAASPTYSKILFNGKPQIPSIPKIQRLIEAAWEKGFDRQGCEQLGNRVSNTTKWIGATEIVATLTSLKVRCKLLDFHNPSGPQGTHPKLFDWIKNYFQRMEPYKLPLYLQHHGHSRTIVGIEELKGDGGLRLLIFDPSTTKKQMQQFYGAVNNTNLRTIRRTIHGLKAKQYQLVAVTGVLNDKEYEDFKVLRSEKVH